MNFENNNDNNNQTLTLENRSKFFVDAAENVESFSDKEIILKTAFGGLIVSGSGLKLEDLSVEGGKVMLTGKVDSMTFCDIKEKHRFFKDIFR